MNFGKKISWHKNQGDFMLPEFPIKNPTIESVVVPVGKPTLAEPEIRLSEIPGNLVTSTSLEGWLKTVTHFALDIFQVDFCQVLTRDEERGFVVRAADYRDENERTNDIVDPVGLQKLYYRVIQNNHPLLVRKTQDSLSLEEGRALYHYDANSLSLSPLWYADKPFGVLVLGTRVTSPAPNLNDGWLRLLKLVSLQLGRFFQLSSQTEVFPSSYLDTVQVLFGAIDDCDPSISTHSWAVIYLAVLTAEKMGCFPPEIQTIAIAAMLHDIGKIGVPEDILHKKEPLNDPEWRVMRRHPSIGADLVQAVSRLNNVAAIIRSHHERYDGRGYPVGLMGPRIPFGGRILAVVDAYEAIVNGRAYSISRSHRDAVEEIRRCSGTQFDPIVVESFLNLFGDDLN